MRKLAKYPGFTLVCLLFPLYLLAPLTADEPKAATESLSSDVARKADVPAEYRGMGLPLESSQTDSLIRQAEEHFATEEWSRGFSMLDEVLESVTSPRRKRRRPQVSPKRPENAERVARRGRGAVVLGGREAAAVEGDDTEEAPEVQPTEEVFSAKGIRYLPVATALRERLLELPTEARGTYERTYDAPAREALEEALNLPAHRALNALRRVGERYPLTGAGAEAWKARADRLLHSGRYGEAARGYEARLALGEGDEPSLRASLLALAGTGYALANVQAQAERCLSQIASSYPETLVLIRGEAVTGRELGHHPFFEAMRRLSPLAGAHSFSWPCASGTFDHARFPLDADSLPALGSQARWIHTLDHSSGPMRPGRRTAPPSTGVTLERLAFVRRGKEILALDCNTGKEVWNASPGSGGNPMATGFTPVDNDYPSGLGSSGLMIYQPATRERESAATRSAPQEPLVVGLSRTLHMQRRRSGKLTYAPNRLVAYKAKGGKLVWTVGETENERAPTYRLTFSRPPVVSAGLLIAPAVRGESVYAVAVTPAGKVEWVRRLYTHNPPRNRFGSGSPAGAPLATSQGVVVLAGGHGLVCALDAASGDVLWCTRYRSQIRGGYVTPRWISSVPIIVGRTVVIAPPDSDYLTAIDLLTGETVWDRHFPAGDSYSVLGADSRHIYLGSDKVKALHLVEGKDAWESDVIDTISTTTTQHRSDLGARLTSAIVLNNRILVANATGSLALLDVTAGDIARKIRLFDPRMPQTQGLTLFLAEDAILAATSKRIFCLESQENSWKGINEREGEDLFRRARLLRSEGRFTEALEVLEALRKKVQAKKLIERVESDILATARAAARATGDAGFIEDLLEQHGNLLKTRKDVLSLRLLEAQLLQENEDAPPGTGRIERAVEIYLDLANLDGVFATSPEKLEVDVGAYASDALRELGSTGVVLSDAQAQRVAEDEARARALLAKPMTAGESARRAAFLLLRRSNLAVTAEVAAHLVREAEESADRPRAEGILSLLLEDHPGLAENAEVSAKAAELSDSLPREPICPGLAEVLEAQGGSPMSQRCWIESADEYLATSADGSAPMPALFAISGTALRAYDPRGKLLVERDLIEYPDVSNIKAALQSHVEEPAVLHFDGHNLVLSTSAGLYGFTGVSLDGVSQEGVSQEGVSQNDAEGTVARIRPGDFKVAWAKPSRHPLLDASAGGWSGVSLPGGRNFFPEVIFTGTGAPVVLLPNASIYSVNRKTGSLIWRYEQAGVSPASPPVMRGPWLVTRTGSPSGFSLHRVDGRKEGIAHRFVRGPEGNVLGAALTAGGLVAVFAGAQLEAIDVESGRSLWRRRGAPARLAFVTASEVWLSEPGGRLVARSVRSGRELRSVTLPDDTVVVEVFVERSAAGKVVSRTLVLSRGGSRSPSAWYRSKVNTGMDLILLRLSPSGETLWETQLHKGAVTYDGRRYVVSDGRYLIGFNAEAGEGKWYTRLVLIDSEDGSFNEVLSAELHGKGTAQPPRLLVLADGIGVGNADGFGWYGSPLEEVEVEAGGLGAPPDERALENDH